MEELGGSVAFGRRVSYLKYNYQLYLSSLTKYKRILEIGPGKGELLFILNQSNITNIDIIDNDIAILKYCKKTYKINKAIHVSNLNITKSLSAKYDLIVLTQVFEHIPKSSYLSWIMGLYNSLKSNGHLIITVPNGANPLVGTERYGDLQHENIFTIYSFQELMTFANINNQFYKIKGFEIPPNSIINIIRIILQKMLHCFFVFIMIINGGIFQTLMTPNITLVITKK